MICQACWKPKMALQKHHKFSQTKWARKLYKKLIDDPKNIQMVCVDCHASHLSTRLIHWSEKEFCDAFKIKPRSKTERRTETQGLVGLETETRQGLEMEKQAP